MYNGQPNPSQPTQKPPPSTTEWGRPRKGSYCQYKQQKLNKAIIDAYPVTKTNNQNRTNITNNVNTRSYQVNGGGYEGRRNSVSFFGYDKDSNQRQRPLPQRGIQRVQRGMQRVPQRQRDTNKWFERDIAGVGKDQIIGIRDMSTKQLGTRDFGGRQGYKVTNIGMERYGSTQLSSYNRPSQQKQTLDLDYAPRQRSQNYQQTTSSYSISQKPRYDSSQYIQSKSFIEQKTDQRASQGQSQNIPVGSIVPAALRKKVQTVQTYNQGRTGVETYGDIYGEEEQPRTRRERNVDREDRGVNELYRQRYDGTGAYEYKAQRRRDSAYGEFQRGDKVMPTNPQYSVTRPKQNRSHLQAQPASRSFMASNHQEVSTVQARMDSYHHKLRQAQDKCFHSTDRERQRQLRVPYQRDNRQIGTALRPEERRVKQQQIYRDGLRSQFANGQARFHKTPARSKAGFREDSQHTQGNGLGQSRKNLLIQKSKNLQQKVNELSASKRLLTSASKDPKQFKYNAADTERQSNYERIQRIKNNKDRVYQSPFKDNVKSSVDLKGRGQIESFSRNVDQPLKKSDLNIQRSNNTDISQDFIKKSPLRTQKTFDKSSENYNNYAQSKTYQNTNTNAMKKSLNMPEKNVVDNGANGCMNRINALNEKINEKISMLINAYQK